MKIAGIVAEYNPFHNGHAYQIDRTRAEDGGCEATHVVAVMSGHFVQRGEPALLPKADRVKMALAGGADLVLELPLPWAMASAEAFAFGAVSILHALGCVDVLSFGSECGDLTLLARVVDAMESDRFSTLLRYHLDGGIAFPEARQRAVAEIAGDKTAALLARPNNTLGIEYLKALRRLSSPITPFTVSRMGADHDDMAPLGDVASASFLRAVVQAGKLLNAAPYMPRAVYRLLGEAAEAGRCPADTRRLERGVLARLRTLSPADYTRFPGLSEGLENRVAEAVACAASWDELEQAIKTRRYPLTRIRRLLWAAFLGIPKELEQTAPPYIRVLGYTEKGRDILSAARQSSAVLLNRAAQADTFTGEARQVWDLECRAADLYALTLPRPFPTGAEYTTGMIRAAGSRTI